MADNKKYYYMRLNENYFDSDKQIILESLPDGYLYSNILLKLYLKGLKCDGLLMLNDRIPYNAQMIATVTHHQIGTVEKALKLFVDMGFVEVMDNGEIYMLDMQKYVGESSTEAERIRQYRQRVANKTPNQLPEPANNGTETEQMSTQTSTESVQMSTQTSTESVQNPYRKRTESVQNPYKIRTNVHQSIEYRVKSIELNNINNNLECIGGECERGNASACAEAPAPAKKHGKPDDTRHKHGMYSNVLLTDDELTMLKAEFPNDWQARIERLSEYIASKGAKYKSHLATIRAWARKDKPDKARSPNFYLPTEKEEIGSDVNF